MEVLTIGHSNHALDRFISLLGLHLVTDVADVRSSPYSRFCPQFNREPLERVLCERGIRYTFCGLELGARPEDPSCYEAGRVLYRRLAATAPFRSGLDRVVTMAESGRLVLMCAEAEPLECHRALLISRELSARGASVSHVMADGRLEAHAESVARLLKLLRMPETDLFRSRARTIEEAYARQEERIASAAKGIRDSEEEGGE